MGLLALFNRLNTGTHMLLLSDCSLCSSVLMDAIGQEDIVLKATKQPCVCVCVWSSFGLERPGESDM